jgi:S-adenosylmethionine hydrolase
MPITLTTDFGLSDHYVGTMKGVILRIHPEARMVDISHAVPPYDVRRAAFLVEQAWRFFPPGTVHVVVVDPGVGSARRPILLEAGGQFFVAPDNGVLSAVIAGAGTAVVRSIDATEYFLTAVSRTFHGRDVFAPVAAHLSLGVPARKFGAEIDNYLRLTLEQPVRTARRGWTGQIAAIDAFGNVITNFSSEQFAQVEQQAFEISIGMERVTRLVQSYAEAPPGVIAAIAGSSGFLEIACNQGSAAARLGVGIGAPVELRLLGS